MVAISLSLLFATINSCLVILQVTLHCYFLSTDNIFCHIGVQKDVLCLPNGLARLWICLVRYGGVDGAEACARHADHLSQPVRKPRKALKRLSTTAPVNQKSTSTINLNTVSLAISQTLSSSSQV